MTPLAVVSCGRCRGPIEVADGEVIAQLERGRAVAIFHDHCVSVAAALRRFVVNVRVSETTGEAEEESTDDLVGFSANVEGVSFTEALPELERRLGELWKKVADHAGVVDGVQPPNPAPNPTPDPEAAAVVGFEAGSPGLI